MGALTKVEREVDGIADKLGKPVDRKIKHLVVALKAKDFSTTGSCQGHLNRGFPYPWVEIDFDEDSFDQTKVEGNRKLRQKANRLLNEFYKTFKSEHPILLQRIGIYGAFRFQNVSWNQAKASKLKLSTNALLEEYRQEMDAFADFLLAKK